MSNSLVLQGSLQQLAENTGKQIRDLFIDVELVVLLDTSLSMSELDHSDKSRYERACDELRKLQAANPGKIALISWSSEAEWCFGGIPTFRGNSTDLAGALRFVKQVDNPYITFAIISDGEPDSEKDALEAARLMQGKINTVYVGPELGRGREFLARLASQKKGTYSLNEFGKELGATVQRMLEVTN